MNFARELECFLEQHEIKFTAEDFNIYLPMEELKYLFETLGAFLNGIKNNEDAKDLLKDIVNWIEEYYVANPINCKKSPSIVTGKDSGKEIKRISNIIKNFETEIERLYGFVNDIELSNDLKEDKNKEFIPFRKIIEMYETAKSIRDELEKREFSKWTDREDFYKPTLTTKKELFDLLREANRNFGLGATYADIKALVDALPQWQ